MGTRIKQIENTKFSLQKHLERRDEFDFSSWMSPSEPENANDAAKPPYLSPLTSLTDLVFLAQDIHAAPAHRPLPHAKAFTRSYANPYETYAEEPAAQDDKDSGQYVFDFMHERLPAAGELMDREV